MKRATEFDKWWSRRRFYPTNNNSFFFDKYNMKQAFNAGVRAGKRAKGKGKP